MTLIATAVASVIGLHWPAGVAVGMSDAVEPAAPPLIETADTVAFPVSRFRILAVNTGTIPREGVIPAQIASYPTVIDWQGVNVQLGYVNGVYVGPDTVDESQRVILNFGDLERGKPRMFAPSGLRTIETAVRSILGRQPFGLEVAEVETAPNQFEEQIDGTFADLRSSNLVEINVVAYEPVFPLGKLNLAYATNQNTEGLPTTEELLETPVTVGYEHGAYGAAANAVETVGPVSIRELTAGEPKMFTRRGLEAVQQAIVDRLGRNLVGVFVVADPNQINVDPNTARLIDNRPSADLDFNIIVGRVAAVRTVGLGSRVDPAERVNAEIHRRIRQNSPVQPPVEGAPGPLLKKRELDEYVARLNRNPARRVDVALSNWSDQNDLAVDYLVTESKSWIGYVQLANNGTESTNQWRTRLGFVDYQFTNNDDIFSVEGVSGAEFDGSSYGVTLGYDTPVMQSDRLRFRLGAGFSRFDASDVGAIGQNFVGTDFNASAELGYLFWQRNTLMAEAVGGLRFRNIYVENDLAFNPTEVTNLLEPYVGLRLEESTNTRSLNVYANLVAGWLSQDDEVKLSALGRSDPDNSYLLAELGGSASFYLEPIFDRANFDRGSSTLAHELYFSARGQAVLNDSRLIAQREETVGGFYSVRGYPESLVAGDHAVYATAEYRLHVPRLLKPYTFAGGDAPTKDILGRPVVKGGESGWFRDPFLVRPPYAYARPDWDLIFRSFVDAGAIYYVDQLSFENEEQLLSVGLGLELQIRGNLTFRADWGLALNEVGDEGSPGHVSSGSSRFHFVFTFIY